MLMAATVAGVKGPGDARTPTVTIYGCQFKV